MRAVTGRPVHVYFSVEAEDGALTAVDSATTVPVNVSDAAGNVVAVGNAASTSTTGVYSFAFTPSALGPFTAVATATVGGFPLTLTVRVEVVGSRITPLSVLRARPNLASLSSIEFLRVVDNTERWVTEMLGYSPVPVSSTVTFRIEWSMDRLHVPGIHYPRRLASLNRDGTAIDLTGVLLDNGESAFRFPVGATDFLNTPTPTWSPVFYPGGYTAVVEHGRWSADGVPGDLQLAVAKLADHLATVDQSLYPERATRVMTEASEIFFGTPDGSKKLTGFPEVDGVLIRYRLNLPV